MLDALDLSRVCVTTITPGNSDSNETPSTNQADIMTITSGTRTTLNTGPLVRNALAGQVLYNHLGQLKVLERDPSRAQPAISNPAPTVTP